MIIHLDNENSRGIDEKVIDLITEKLFVTVDDEQIFIDKDAFVTLILLDVCALAKANSNIEDALKIALINQPQYKEIPDSKRTELVEALEQFPYEVDAFKYYLKAIKEGVSYDEIYLGVIKILNLDVNTLYKRLHEIMIESLDNKISNEDAVTAGVNKMKIIDNHATYIRVFASNHTIDESINKIYDNNADYFNRINLQKVTFAKNMELLNDVYNEEISAYKMGLSLLDQNAEIPMILATVKQLLHLK